MDFDYQILTKVDSDRELWVIHEDMFSTIEETREAVGELMTDLGYRATDVRIVKQYPFKIKVTN